MTSFFITSSGTNIGKTLVTAALAHQLQAAGKKVQALKPVISGYDPDDEASDTAIILKSQNLAPTQENIDAISPWRFAAPLAPAMAAAKEEKSISLQELIKFCRAKTADTLLVEGAGGVMAPLNDHQTMLDWMATLEWPVMLVTGSYLGSLSHTLTALEALKTRRLPLKALIISESENSGVSLDETASALEKFLPGAIPVVKIPRLTARDNLWKQLPDMTWLINER